MLITLALSIPICASSEESTYGTIYGNVASADGDAIDYASVYLKGTPSSCITDERGAYRLQVPPGKYTVVFSSVGFEKQEHLTEIVPGQESRLNVKLASVSRLAEVTVVGNPVNKIKNSAYNAVTISTQDLSNTTKTLGDALQKAPGLKIR